MNNFFDYLFHKPNKLLSILWRILGFYVPDELYLKVQFILLMGKRLNLKNPKTYCEKLQWLKLYDRRPEYVTMVDKVAVKDYVSSIIGEEYIIPTLGVWENPKDIEWDALPNQFVLKCTHDSGGLVICRDKTKLNKTVAMKKLQKKLKQNYYKVWREWPYKEVPRRIIAEKYIEPMPNQKDLPDYKWYCFDGEPKFCQVIQDRYSIETIDFFDTNWKHMDFIGLNPKADNAINPPVRPINLSKQLDLVKRLASGIPFSRIDLYIIDETILFGEITLYPMSGFGLFRPYHYNKILGDMIDLNTIKR